MVAKFQSKIPVEVTLSIEEVIHRSTCSAWYCYIPLKIFTRVISCSIATMLLP